MDEKLARLLADDVRDAVSAIAAARQRLDGLPTNEEIQELQLFLTASAARLHHGVVSRIANHHPSLASMADDLLKQMGFTEANAGGVPDAKADRAAPSDADVIARARELRDTWIEATILLSRTFRAARGLIHLEGWPSLRNAIPRVIADINLDLLNRVHVLVPEINTTREDFGRIREQMERRKPS